MKTRTLKNIIDFILKTVLCFCIFFVWIRFYVYSLPQTITYASFSTIIVLLIMQTLKKNKEHIYNTSKKETFFIASYTNEFLFSSTRENKVFFYKLLKQKHQVFLNKPFLVLKKTTTNIAFYPYYKTRVLSMDTAKNLITLAKQKGFKKLIVTCKTCEQEVFNLAKQFKLLELIVLNEKETYLKLLKPYNYYPKITVNLIEEKKLTFKQILLVMFDKKRTKGYLISGFILMLSSFIVPYNIYYVLFSSVLFFLALISYFHTPIHKKLPRNMLEDENN